MLFAIGLPLSRRKVSHSNASFLRLPVVVLADAILIVNMISRLTALSLAAALAALKQS
jgi:hypothetical protein